VEILSRQLNELEANYNQITRHNEEEVAKSHKLEGEVQVLNHQLKELKEKPSVPANYQEFQVQCK
jgi:chromosome segregation ATPase